MHRMRIVYGSSLGYYVTMMQQLYQNFVNNLWVHPEIFITLFIKQIATIQGKQRCIQSMKCRMKLLIRPRNLFQQRRHNNQVRLLCLPKLLLDVLRSLPKVFVGP